MEYSTIRTVMITAQKMTAKLHQDKTVITVDKAMYSKAKQIQWKSDQFQDDVLRMGGFQIALNFFGVMGHLYEAIGFEDLFIESGLYGSSNVTNLLKGKMHNRGIRAHKLLLEALMRLRWKAFCRCLSDRNADVNEAECNLVLQKFQRLLKEDDCESLTKRDD